MADEPTELERAVELAIEAKLHIGAHPWPEIHGIKEAARAAIAECFKWRPIAEAPKDGTSILVTRLGADIGPDPMEITKWCIMEECPRFEHVEGDLYRKIAVEPSMFWDGNGHRATHWMPLPPPPEDDHG